MENLDDRAIEQVADFFGAFSVPMRLKILNALRGTSAYYRIVDPRIYQLCDLVCVQIGQRFAHQADMKDVFLKAGRATTAPARKASARRR